MCYISGMKHFTKRIAIVLFAVVLLLPVRALAATPDEINAQRIDLINQLITLLQEQVVSLQAQLVAQQEDITTLKMPTFGSINMSDPTPYTVNVVTELGTDSRIDFNAQCRGDNPASDCDSRFLQGQVKFTIDAPYKKATISWKSSTTDSGINDFDTNTKTNHQALTGVQSGFEPNTDYTWEVVATNDAGESAKTTGTFTTGSY